MKNCTDLNRGKVVYISNFYHIPDSGLYLLNGVNFNFESVTRKNQLFSQVAQPYRSLQISTLIMNN